MPLFSLVCQNALHHRLLLPALPATPHTPFSKKQTPPNTMILQTAQSVLVERLNIYIERQGWLSSPLLTLLMDRQAWSGVKQRGKYNEVLPVRTKVGK